MNFKHKKKILGTKLDFKEIFNNTLDNQNYEVDITGVTKINSSKDLVYTWVERKSSIANKYELNLNIPRVNISSTSVEKFNNQIKDIYVAKANEIIANAKNNTNNNMLTNSINNTINNENNNNINSNSLNNIDSDNINNTTIYTVEYASYINTNILSLAVKSTLKEGNNPQRVMIQTYNYNLSTNEEIKLSSILEIKGLDVATVNNAIKAEVTKANNESNSLKELGYEVYSRDLSSEIYDVQNATNYMLGKDNRLYIIYAYGNSNFTDEMDIISF